ncbi:tRNA pseudouridine synthase B [Marinitoga sp. 1135]|uniref:tRNA pseudouridine(55) synthase TruB n=1 Tax=Marinitoga sp. 1135 TaxID=1643333 RepID=UPI001585F544|nr:tRNA pseudouridine(55) synthase TruB [Marinitoga sp. 1135]NUU95932.1 tRNA pseudouridine synthase B [Marinitoga sp. 1135]
MNNGFLLVDKPEGITSHDVVNEIRKIFSSKKVGHSGTLDPFATGLLIIGVNKGTRLLEYLQHQDKVYHVKAKLGIITDTFDITGKITEKNEFTNSEIEKLEDTIISFIGKYKQVPPMYSARKYKGKKLYELAREGKIIKMPPKEVEIYDIWNISIKDHGEFEFTCKVSSGTYIRSLIMDIGYKIGCGAVTTELRRLNVGKFSIDKAVELEKISSENLIPLLDVLDFPKVILNNEGIENVKHGRQIVVDNIIKFEDFKKDTLVSLIDNKNNLLAIAKAERTSSFINTLINQNRNERVFKLKKVFI